MRATVADRRYTLRRADLPVAVMALDEICFPGDDRVNPDGALWWIVWQGKTPVAYAGLRLCQDPRNLGLAFLNRALGLKPRTIFIRRSSSS